MEKVKRTKLDEEIQKKKEKLTDLEQVVSTLLDYKEELQKQRDQLRVNKEVEEELTSKIKRAKREELIKIIIYAKNVLLQRKEENEQLAQNTSELKNKANIVCTEIENRMKKIGAVAQYRSLEHTD